jgi:hypothetical protein
MKSKLPVILAALFALAVAETPEAHAAPPADPCSLLTTQQVNTALGVAVAAGKGLGQSCQWSQTGKELGGKGMLLTILGPIGTLTPVQQFDAIKTPLPVKGITKTPVSGLGDDAVYGQTGASGPELTVKKGNSVFQIKVYGLPVEEIKTKEKTLAQEVLARL